MTPSRIFLWLATGVMFGAFCAVLSFGAAGAIVGRNTWHARREHAARAMPVCVAQPPAIVDISAEGFVRGTIPFVRVLGLLPGERIDSIDGVSTEELLTSALGQTPYHIDLTAGHFLDVQISGRGARRELVLVHP